MTRDSRAIVRSLLELQTWALFDIDAAGRILAGNDQTGSMQLVELDPDGTATFLTDLPSRCSGRYVPGTEPRQVIVQHDSGGDERMQLSTLTAVPGRQPYTLAELEPLVHDPAYLHVLEDVTETSLVYATNRRNGTDFDVIRRELLSGTETVLYDEGGYIADVEASHDQRSVAVTALSRQPASTEVFLAGERSGPCTLPGEHAHHGDVAWSASDDALIMSSNHDREYAGIFAVSLDGTRWEPLVTAGDHDLSVWAAPDGSTIVVGHRVDGLTELVIHDPDGSERIPADLPAAEVGTLAWAPDAQTFAVWVTSPSDPGSIFRVDVKTGSATRVVDGRDQLPAGLPLSEPSVHRIPAPAGEQIPCFVYPAANDAGPTLAGASVLHIHGGPEGEATRAFSPLLQALAAAGFTVLVPNVRGSDGYGKRWVSLDDVRYRLDSVADLAAVHAWLPQIGLDPERSALWGGSYGGYMVLAGVTMQPDLWAAGVDIVGISSLVTFLENTSDYRRAFREREYGRLDEDRDFLVSASPITHLDQLRAPLFVIHGANDPRVPLSEAEQIAAALQQRGIAHELKVYDDEGHGLAKRANRLDAYPAAIDFLGSVLSAHPTS